MLNYICSYCASLRKETVLANISSKYKWSKDVHIEGQGSDKEHKKENKPKGDTPW